MSSKGMVRVIFLVVFAVWLMIWVMLPTKLYKNTWTPNLETTLNSTYFSGQGTNLLLFSFPLMFIAAFGCAYLHFQNKSTDSSNHSKRLGLDSATALLKRPAVVMAPLGIVSVLELTFASMFVALLIWSLANYLYVSFGNLHMHTEGEKIWEAKLRSVSLRLGYVGNICWAFVFFPVTRGSSVLPLIGLTSESSIKYHIWLGHLSNILFAAHTIGFIIYWAITNQMAEMVEWSKTWVSNVAGVIAIVIAMPMWVTSLPQFRRMKFELFFYTHHLYLLYIFFYVLHVGDAYFCMILPGIFLFLIDRYLRFLQSRQRTALLSARILPCGLLELNFSKTPGLYYNPTSILFVNVPRISKLQWHPFTVSSNCNMETDYLSVVIKCQGSWSHKLYKELGSSLDRLQCLVLVSGGSGITPFISIIREIIFQIQKPNFKVPRVIMICAFKNSADLAMLDLLLPISGTPPQISQIQLQIEAYITREEEQPMTETHKPLQTIWFKPSPLDSPISKTLGPNNWLWLGAIISSSFLMFLLLLGIVTRYYIYPIDHNTEQIYHFSYRALWDMFLVCVCIFIVSSVVFLWCKKQNAREGNRIPNREIATPVTSPGVSPCFSGAELESLPHQSLVQATKVHFGSRPDFKKTLLDLKESDVGVLACGPRKMRHDVAKICASGLAQNLHFESISFTL
ncbi:hypothetical protein CXB51_021935 [Gossypium anomalum]|uniref:ferric-chelate reductase (NADH) n=1 Tax=Gossypium anomalum TaxID=47600 RepID=A0A8J5Y6K7_9ROSI|nr:hypothetical protein CXB51_021935 [Gossypium anomalum]